MHSKSVDRRTFLKGSLTAGAFAMFPGWLTDFFQITTPSVMPDGRLSLLRFAQLTDIHLGDVSNYLRHNFLLGIVSYFYERPQDPMAGKLLDAVIHEVNLVHQENPLGFCMLTGDLIDCAMLNEVQWFVDIADGKAPRDFCPEMVAVDNPEGFQAPWYACLGNHDMLVIGSFGGTLFRKLLENMQANHGFSIITHQEWMAAMEASDKPAAGHGFDDQPQAHDGYYSFSPSPCVHAIVLNTTTDNWMEGMVELFSDEKAKTLKAMAAKNLSAEENTTILMQEFSQWLRDRGFIDYMAGSKSIGDLDEDLQTLLVIGSGGTLDRDQYQWMIDEIESNPGKLCLIFSHHGSCDFGLIAGNVQQDEFDATLAAHNNVIAHVCGHSHKNCIETIADADSSYYRIRTSSIIEYPQEWRTVELIADQQSQKGVIRCRMFGHNYTAAFNTAKKHWRVQDSLDENAGTDSDRDVDLEFTIPLQVLAAIEQAASGNCFIRTAL